MTPTERVLKLLDLARHNVRSGVESIEDIQQVFANRMLDFAPAERVFLACAFVDEISIECFWRTFCGNPEGQPRPGAWLSERMLNGAMADGSAPRAPDSPAGRGSPHYLHVGGRADPPPSPN